MNQSTEKINCECGSILLNEKSLNKHLYSKRHDTFVRTGLMKPLNASEYQRRRFHLNPEKRLKQNKISQEYYYENRENILLKRRLRLIFN